MSLSTSESEYSKIVLGPDEIIVVTGGSGFLGQHIIRVLQQRAAGVKEIRVVDVVPYKKKLEFKEIIPVVFYKCDITVEDNLDRAFNGATSVIHSAAIVNVGHYVDRAEMRSVNIIGTTNIISKCRQWNIPKLVITSTVDAVFTPSSNFTNQKEIDTELPDKERDILMGYYGFTKAQTEAYALCSKSHPLRNGNKMLSTILRPTVLYGELDPFYVPSAMKVAKAFGGYLVKPSMFNEPVLQSTYAGNAAWAHLLALEKLRSEINNNSSSEKTKNIDGETFFLSDDTESGSIYQFMKPFLTLKGYKTVNFPIPYFILLFFVLLTSFIIQTIFPLSWQKFLNKHPVCPTPAGFRMAHSSVECSYKKATEFLGYKPIYSEEDAKLNSAEYYKNVSV